MGELPNVNTADVVLTPLVSVTTIAVYLHSKNSRVRFDPEKSPRGPDPFWGQTYPESRWDWPGIRVRKTFWTQIPVIFTRIPDQSDPGMGLAPWDPFPGQIWPRSF